MLTRLSHSRSPTPLSGLTLGISLAVALAACTPDLGASSGDGGAGGGATSATSSSAGGTDPGDPLANLPAPKLPTPMLSYAAKLPASFETPLVHGYDDTAEGNPTTDAGATLGRVLFYDRRLSANGKVACASCHQQKHGFSDDRAKSLGFEGKETARHSMPVLDTRFYRRGKFFWDERADSLEAQVLGPIQSDVEMGMKLDALESRLAQTDYYAPLFKAAFGDETVSRERIARALSQFLRSMVSYRSRWDAAMAQVDSIVGDLPGFSEAENRGKQIFFGQHDPSTRGLCGTCHLMQNELSFTPPGAPKPPGSNAAIFYMGAPANNGLPNNADKGVGAISGLAKDDGKFKSPSLRNVALRPPYMHDGRFKTLAEVVEHYNSGIAADPNLDPALRQGAPNGPPMKLGLSEDDKAALVAFLMTLNDATLATDVRLSDPFPAP
ncbi:MAG: cytochrome c peroxidase [Byssovorax sp.]